MIQENELRIGNYVCNHVYIGIVESIDKKGCIVNYISDNIEGFTNNKFIKPIPQTEEWLLKFGFEKTNIKMSGCNVWQKGKYRVLKSYLNDDNSYSLCIDGITPPTWAIAKFEYVHQFQNIYFALEKQELEIKIK
jgi:hypothetical protein